MSADYTVGYFIGIIIVSVICGFICKGISSNRGMEGGFWWGFWLWIIGIIVVAVRPNDSKPVSASTNTETDRTAQPSTTSYRNRSQYEKSILDAGGWKCSKCGNVNHDYTLYCLCGNAKETSLTETPINTEKKGEDSPTLAIELRQLKELVDDGIITQEEFEAKKKKLLGL